MNETTFAQRLKTLRDAFSVSQLKLAEGLGVKQYYITKWESGSYVPNLTIKHKIASLFQVSALWLSDGLGNVFNGIVFIPKNLIPPEERLNWQIQQRIVSFICMDGASPTGILYRGGEQVDGLFLFTRGEELLLFLPHVSLFKTTSTYLLKDAMLKALTPYYAQDAVKSVNTVWDGPKLYQLSAEQFDMVKSGSSLADIENILQITVPKNLREGYVAPRVEETDIRKEEWKFTVELNYICHHGGITESNARNEIMNIEKMFRDKNDEKEIYIMKIIRKK